MKASSLIKRFSTQYKNRKCFVYTIDDKKFYFEQLTFRVKIKHPEEWLEKQSLFPKIFWRGKHQKTWQLALGSIINFSSLPKIEAPARQKKGPRVFGGVAFLDSLLSKTKYSVWHKFTSTPFFIPKVEIKLGIEGNGLLYINLLKGEEKKDILAFAKELIFEEDLFSPLKLKMIQRIDLPNFSTWCDTIEKSMNCFETTSLKKVVLARASYLSYDRPLCALMLLKELAKTAKNSTLFAYIPSQEGAFVGVSPENFYIRKGRQIVAEAVAGSSSKGATEQENQKKIEQLLTSHKEDVEFSYVTQFLKEKLSTLCQKVKTKTKKSITETSALFHLHKAFQGFLKPSITDKLIVETLHPTPAMGGYPQTLAVEFLDQSEPFVRGLYASPVGWISPSYTELVIAIRSAFVKNQCLTVFAGAGITEDSHSSKEWEELELKISHFLQLGSACS